MKVTFIKYYKRVSIWQETERNEVEMSRNEINAMKKKQRLFFTMKN